MKIDFNDFRYLFLESLLSEDKSRLIDKLILTDIEDEDEKLRAKAEMKAFFKKYANWENKLDWNKLKTITYADFEKIKNQATQTKGYQKREIASDIKSIFKSTGDRRFEIVGENDDWLFVTPLTYKAAVYCDSSENQGAGAKWCIGYKSSDNYWDQYVNDEGSLFIMAFNKKYKSLNDDEIKKLLKFMIEYTINDEINVWNQADRKNKKIGIFSVDRNELEQMFSKVRELYANEKQRALNALKRKFENKIKNLKKMIKIPAKYFADLPLNIKDNFKEIEIPDNIQIIGENAFCNCYKLQSVKIPDSVVEIYKKAFAYCDLKTIKLPNKLDRIEESVFEGCSLESIVIPKSVKIIGETSFYGCRKLKSITLPNTLTTIGAGAFQECTALESIVIPKSVTYIDEFAFYYCKNLKSIVFEGRTLQEIQSMKNYKTWKINISKIIKPGK